MMILIRYCVAILFTSLLLPGNSQNRITDASKSILTDSSIFKNANKSAFEVFLDEYADSVNNAKNIASFPFFLKNAQFDYTNSGIWSPDHQPLSLRTMIINRVTNCNSLKLIIDSKDVRYRKVPQKMHDIDVDNLNLSFYDLVKTRYKELKCDSCCISKKGFVGIWQQNSSLVRDGLNQTLSLKKTEPLF